MNKSIWAKARQVAGETLGGFISGTEVTGDKYALDVYVRGQVAGSGVSTSSEIYNETINSTNTEQSVALPTSIVGYMIKARDCNTDLKLSHVSGESGSKYISIPGGGVFTDTRPYSNLTLYFQSSVSGGVVEVIAWS